MTNLIEHLLFVADVHSDEDEGEESSISLMCVRAVGEIRRLGAENAELRDAVGAALNLFAESTCESGICMCGDSVIGHADLSVGHSACDSGAYHQDLLLKRLSALLQLEKTK